MIIYINVNIEYVNMNRGGVGGVERETFEDNYFCFLAVGIFIK